MSADGNQIICRKCQESISQDNETCPNCGTSLRGTVGYAIGIVFGGILIGAAVLNLSELLAYGVIGLVIAATSAYFIYEKRQRISEAAQQTQQFEG